jgi:excisionase family DNA binding protein
MKKKKAGLGVTGTKGTAPQSVPRLLTVGEVAEATGLQVGTVYAWIGQRRLPVVRLRRSVRVPADALRKLIAEATVPALGEKP